MEVKVITLFPSLLFVVFMFTFTSIGCCPIQLTAALITILQFSSPISSNPLCMNCVFSSNPSTLGVSSGHLSSLQSQHHWNGLTRWFKLCDMPSFLISMEFISRATVVSWFFLLIEVKKWTSGLQFLKVYQQVVKQQCHRPSPNHFSLLQETNC